MDIEKEDYYKTSRIAKRLRDKNLETGCSRSDSFGLCGNCLHFANIDYEFGDSYSYCHAYDMNRKSDRRVKNCSGYKMKTMLGIKDMWEIATLIDLGPKNEIGFFSKTIEVTTKKAKLNEDYAEIGDY